MSRVKLRGTYASKETYDLSDENGNLYMRISANTPFRLYEGGETFYTVLEPFENKRTRISCFNLNPETAKVSNLFYLQNNFVGLWATCEEELKHGVYHRYTCDEDYILSYLLDKGVPKRSIELVSGITCQLDIPQARGTGKRNMIVLTDSESTVLDQHDGYNLTGLVGGSYLFVIEGYVEGKTPSIGSCITKAIIHKKADIGKIEEAFNTLVLPEIEAAATEEIMNPVKDSTDFFG